MKILIAGDDLDAWAALGMPRSVPWELVAPHEKQADANHDQTLAQLDKRGGVSPCELIAILEDRDWRRMALAECAHRLRFFLEQATRATCICDRRDPGNGPDETCPMHGSRL